MELLQVQSLHRLLELCATARKLIKAARVHGTGFMQDLRVSGRPLVKIIEPDHMVRSPYPDVTIPECSLYDHVFSKVDQYGQKVAIVDGVTGREYSYSQLHNSVTSFSSGLNRLGFQKGDVIALCALNCPQYAIMFFGVLGSGGVVTTCNPTYTAEELAYQFKDSGAKNVATMAAFLPSVKKAADMAGIGTIIVIDDHSMKDHGYVSYQSLVTDSGSRFVTQKVDAKNDVAVLPYSSGTTGLPKGVMLTHHNLVANICQSSIPEFFDLKFDGSTVLGLLPFFHIYGMQATLTSSLYQGARVVILPKFDPTLFLSTIEKYSVHLAHLVPPIILFLAKHPDVGKYDLSSLRHIIISGAAPLGSDLSKSASTRLQGKTMIVQGYGLTETSPVTHATPIVFGMSRPGSVGVPILNQLVKVVDVDSGKNLPSGQEGEIYIKGPNVMKGYLNQPDATKKTLTEDGWLKTGDIGYFDQDGFFYITDRLKELIKVKGLQVAPAELEALLQNHPKVADAAVIGVPHKRHGEAPRAFVVKRDPTLTEKELTDYIASHVSEHKHLTGGVKFIEAVPKTTSGKILRRHFKKHDVLYT